MGWYFVIALALVPFVFRADPVPGFVYSRDIIRNLDCQRISGEQGAARYPGLIPAPKPRGEFLEREVVICKERMVRPGLRDAPDEAILSTLQAQVTELAAAARSTRPDLDEHSWLVEAHHMDVQVASKIDFATQNALAQQGLSVSDRDPVLGLDDIQVITRLAPMQAHEAACRRYADTGSLGEGDALLAVMLLDPRETILHAGVCAEGGWQWLR
jgi:hypothetical protein